MLPSKTIFSFIFIAIFMMLGGHVSASTLQASHIVDTYYSGYSPDTRKVETDFTAELGEVSYYFVATNVQFGKGCVGVCNAYAGLQTNGLINGKWVGKMAIFSLWDAPSATPADGVQKVRFTGEGEGYSLRFPYDWRIGNTYRLSLEFVQGNDKAPLLKASIMDVGSDTTKEFGTIALPGAFDSFKLISTFHEYFGSGEANCAVDNPSAWRIERVTIDSGLSILPVSQSYIDSANKYPDCKNLAWFTQTETGIRSAAGILEKDINTALEREKSADNQITENSNKTLPVFILFLIASLLLIIRHKSL